MTTLMKKHQFLDHYDFSGRERDVFGRVYDIISDGGWEYIVGSDDCCHERWALPHSAHLQAADHVKHYRICTDDYDTARLFCAPSERRSHAANGLSDVVEACYTEWQVELEWVLGAELCVALQAINDQRIVADAIHAFQLRRDE